MPLVQNNQDPNQVLRIRPEEMAEYSGGWHEIQDTGLNLSGIGMGSAGFENSKSRAPTFAEMTGNKQGVIRIRNRDGSERNVATDTPEMVTLLTAGGQVIDPTDGKPMRMVPDFYGGWVGINAEGIPLPLNFVATGKWQPGQDVLIDNAMLAGWKPGDKLPKLPKQVADLYPKLAQKYGSGPASYDPKNPFAGYKWTPKGAGHFLTLRGPDGKTERVDAGDYQEVDRRTRSGWIPLNEKGNPYQVTDHQGGQMFYDPDRQQWMPINVLLGGEWLDAQLDEMPNFGRTAIDKGLPGGGGTYGDLAEGFTERFNYPDLPLSLTGAPFAEEFKFDPTQFSKTDSYQNLVAEGLKAIDASRSAGGLLKNSGIFQSAQRFGQGLASQEMGKDFDRQLQSYGTRFDVDAANKARLSQEYEKGYGRKFGEYSTRFDIDRANKNDVYNRYAGLSNTGQVATGQVGQLGSNFAGRAGGLITDQGNVQAGGVLGRAQARSLGVSGAAGSVSDYYNLRKYGLAA